MDQPHDVFYCLSLQSLTSQAVGSHDHNWTDVADEAIYTAQIQEHWVSQTADQ